MAIVALSTSPATLDSGSSDYVSVVNTGAVDVTVARGSQSFTLRPNQSRTVYPEGSAVTATVASGTGQVTTTAQAAQVTQAQQVTANTAAIAGLPGTYARVSKSRAGNNFGYIGDSLTAASHPGPSVPQYAELLSGGRLHCGVNAGISGNTSSQMLARITDVTGTAVNTCVILAGTNDLPTFTLAQTMSNIEAMVAALRAAGITPILGLIPPRLAYRAKVAQWNLAYMLYALKNQIQVVDYCAPLMDPATGDFLSAYASGDGTHPNAAGYKVMAQALVTALTGGPLDAFTLLPVVDNADGTNLFANPLALASSAGVPTGSGNGTFGGTTNITRSVDSADAGIIGNWWVSTLATATTFGGFKLGKGTGYSVGDKLLLTGRAKAATATTGDMTVQVQFYSANTQKIIQAVPGTFDGRFAKALTVPASTSFVELQLAGGNLSTGGTGEWRWAQLGMHNLTTLGIDALGYTP